MPRLSLASVAALRAEICEQVAVRYYADLLEGPDYAGFADELAKALGRRGVDRAVSDATCLLLLGRALTDARLLAFAWRVAGNLDRLRAGVPLGPTQLPERPEWAPMQVLSSLQSASRKGSQGSEFTLRALAGPCCPLLVRKFWSRKVYTFLARQLGFTAPWGAMGFQHPAQLVGLRLFGLVDPALCRDGSPGFREVAASPSMLGHNRGVLARRFRAGGARCPFGYDGDRFVPCHRCAVGYAGKDGEEGCLAACHRLPYEAAPCPACGRPDAPFDPDVAGGLCLECTVRARTKGGR